MDSFNFEPIDGSFSAPSTNLNLFPLHSYNNLHNSSSGLSLSPQRVPGSLQMPPPSIEALELPDLFRNQHVRQLYDKCEKLSNKVMDLQQQVIHLTERVSNTEIR